MALDNCTVNGGNSGGVLCSPKMGRIVKAFLGSGQFTSTDYATNTSLQTAFLNAFKLATGSNNKLFALPEIQENDVAAGADTFGKLAFGAERRLAKLPPSYTGTIDISYYHYQKLLAFDGRVFPVYYLDDLNNIWGIRNAAAANTLNTNNWRGLPTYVTVQGYGFGNGTDPKVGKATIKLAVESISDFEKKMVSVQFPTLGASDYAGLTDITLINVSHSANVWKFGLNIPMPVIGGDLNVYGDVGAAIAALTFTAFTGSPNFTTSLPITTVGLDATTQTLVITFDSTTYNALATGTLIKLIAPTPAVMNTANIIDNNGYGYEIQPIIITK